MNRARALRLAPLVAILVAAAGLAAFLPVSPDRLDPRASWAPPSAAHLFGAAEGGVDVASLVAHAVLRGAALAVLVALFGFAFGTPLGAAAALARGRFERVVERSCDLLQAFPTFLLALAVLSAVRSPTRVHVGIVFAITAWSPFARLALAETRVLRGAAFVDAATALGATRAAVLVRHVLPNLLGVGAVQLGGTAASVVVSEAALAFVGFGPRDGVSLGAMLDQGVAGMLRAPHVLVAGSLAVFATSVAMMIAGGAAAAPQK